MPARIDAAGHFEQGLAAGSSRSRVGLRSPGDVGIWANAPVTRNKKIRPRFNTAGDL